MDSKLVPDGVTQAYTSTDFEFVAFLLAYENPKVELFALIPENDKRGRDRYVFAIVGAGNDPDWFDKLETLRSDYVNQRTSIEPSSLAAKRKLLRGIVLDGSQRQRNKVRILAATGKKG